MTRSEVELLKSFLDSQRVAYSNDYITVREPVFTEDGGWVEIRLSKGALEDRSFFLIRIPLES